MKFDQLLAAAQELDIPSKLIEVWIPREKFVDAVIQDKSLSITRIDEPFYGMAIGSNPLIDKRWSHFSCSRSTPKELTAGFELQGQWDAYGIGTSAQEVNYQELTDFDFINELIEKHAPQSSIRAEDSEVVAWIGIDEIALGAICKWESGFHVLSSIVVAEEQRGKGFGKAVTKALIDSAHKKGIGYLALGVWAKNEAAIATYKSIGFTELGQFNSFS